MDREAEVSRKKSFNAYEWHDTKRQEILGIIFLQSKRILHYPLDNTRHHDNVGHAGRGH